MTLSLCQGLGAGPPSPQCFPTLPILCPHSAPEVGLWVRSSGWEHRGQTTPVALCQSPLGRWPVTVQENSGRCFHLFVSSPGLGFTSLGTQGPRPLTPILTLTLKQSPFLIVVPTVRGRPAAGAASIPHPGNRGPTPHFPCLFIPPGQLPKARLSTSPPHPPRSHRVGWGAGWGPGCLCSFLEYSRPVTCE